MLAADEKREYTGIVAAPPLGFSANGLQREIRCRRTGISASGRTHRDR
jgi:hypothetical protein